MPLQSLFTSALLSDIDSSHLLQQTIAALQANKFVQVGVDVYVQHTASATACPSNTAVLFLFLTCPSQPLLGRRNEMEKRRKEIKELWKQEQNKMVGIPWSFSQRVSRQFLISYLSLLNTVLTSLPKTLQKPTQWALHTLCLTLLV
jgi:hypothetical protein